MPPPPCCHPSASPRHPPQSLPVNVVRARLICERLQAGLSLYCTCTCESGPHALLADDNLPFLSCSRLLPFLGSPIACPRAGTGQRWTTRNSACGRRPRLRGFDGSGGFLPPRPLRPHGVKAGSRVSHLHNRRLQGTSLTAIFCSLLPPFSTCSPGFVAKFGTCSCLSHQTNVPSSSKSCAALRLHSLSIVFGPLRLGATLNLLCHGYLRSSHHPFKLPCIMTVSNVNGRCASVSKIIHSSAVKALNVSIIVAYLGVWTVAQKYDPKFCHGWGTCLLYVRVIIGIRFPRSQLLHKCTAQRPIHYYALANQFTS